MPVSFAHEPRHMQLVASISAKGFFKNSRLNQLSDQLFEALQGIRSRLSEDGTETDFYAIDILNVHKPGQEFDPWSDATRQAWSAIARENRVHDKLKTWLTEIEKLIRDVDQLHRGTSSVWENGEVQLGEPAASAFALSDVSFVPYYTRMLRVWDMDHEVNQGDTIAEIIETHGIRPETEELLKVRVTDASGQNGFDQIEDLMPRLEEHYEDFEESELGRLIGRQ